MKIFKMPQKWGVYCIPDIFLDPCYGVSPCIRWLRWEFVWGKTAKKHTGYNRDVT